MTFLGLQLSQMSLQFLDLRDDLLLLDRQLLLLARRGRGLGRSVGHRICGGVRFCDVRAASDGFLAALQFHEMTGLFSRLCASPQRLEPHESPPPSAHTHAAMCGATLASRPDVALKLMHELGSSAVSKNGGFTEDADAALEPAAGAADGGSATEPREWRERFGQLAQQGYGLSAADVAKLAPCMHCRSFGAGELLLRRLGW